MSVRSARPPARWEAAQQQFRDAFARDPSGFERTPVKLVYWTVENPKGTKAQQLWRGIYQAITAGTAAGWFDGTYVALWRPEARDGAPCDLVMEIPSDALEYPEGYGEADLVGEYLLNGACALDLDDLGIVFPKAPPFARRHGVPRL